MNELSPLADLIAVQQSPNPDAAAGERLADAVVDLVLSIIKKKDSENEVHS